MDKIKLMKKEVSLTAKQGSLLREFIFGLNMLCF